MSDSAEPKVAAPAPPPVPRPAIEYERSGPLPVTRRQFRWLLILITLHLAITVQTTYVPNATASFKQWWAEHQERVERDAALKQAAVQERQLLNFAHPHKTVVWEEDPAKASELMATGGYRWARVSPLDSGNTFLANWPRACYAKPPALFINVPIQRGSNDDADVSDEDPILLMHGLKTPSGQERLVVVAMRAVDLLGPGPAAGRFADHFDQDPLPKADEPSTRRIGRVRTLVALPFESGTSDHAMVLMAERISVLNIYPRKDPLVTPWSYTPPETPDGLGKIDLAPWPKLTLFAGQLDASDPSRFTIPYEVDDKPGELRGRLKDDDTIELRPTTGSLRGDRWTPAGG